MADGTLPPLEQRLPANPLVVRPTDQLGTYGETWRYPILGPGDMAKVRISLGYEHLVRWKTDWSGVLPNVAEHVESSPDGRRFTFTLRKGMKWSDGHDFTADDVAFACNDVLLNKELHPVPPPGLMADNSPAKVEKLDASTVRFTFEEPRGLFLQRLCTPRMPVFTSLPFHYLKQFHRQYNSRVSDIAEKAGFSDWTKLLLAKSDYLSNPDIPTIHAWMINVANGSGSRMEATRNPYYWKTDTDGRQLPYIDRILYPFISSPETILLKATHGEVDFMDDTINTPSNKPVLARNRPSGEYEFFDVQSSSMNTAIIMLNLAHKDPAKRRLFQNKDFRIGLSYAIDRKEAINAVYQRQGQPWQAAPQPQMTFYNEKLAKQYTEHDIEQAEKHLDLAGVPRRGGNGPRIGPDGKPVSFTIDVVTGGFRPEWTDLLELIRGYWSNVGIDMRLKGEDRTLFYERMAANAHDGAIWEGDGGMQDAILKPAYYLPMHTSQSRYAIPWAQWYTSKGASGEEPPEIVKRQMALYDKLERETSKKARTGLLQQILAIAQEQFWVMGIDLAPAQYGIVSHRFHNLPKRLIWAWLFCQPAVYNSSQFFISD